MIHHPYVHTKKVLQLFVNPPKQEGCDTVDAEMKVNCDDRTQQTGNMWDGPSSENERVRSRYQARLKAACEMKNQQAGLRLQIPVLSFASVAPFGLP